MFALEDGLFELLKYIVSFFLFSSFYKDFHSPYKVYIFFNKGKLSIQWIVEILSCLFINAKDLFWRSLKYYIIRIDIKVNQIGTINIYCQILIAYLFI